MNTTELHDERQRDRIVRQYQPLVHKIAKQQQDKTALSMDDVIGFAEEGLVDAMNTYNPDKGQSFKSYAAYRILYFIQNGSNSQGHTVKFSAYMQKKVKDEGKSTWIMKTIDVRTDEDGNEHYNIPVPSCEMILTNPEDIYRDLFSMIENKFSKRDCKIFYQSFGLKRYKQHKGIELAKKYGCSSTNITLINKKIIRYIQGQPVIMDRLSEMLDY